MKFDDYSIFNEFFRNADRYSVGYNNLFNETTKFMSELSGLSGNYPPYNISQIDDNKYLIEVAVAGFGSQNIEITLDGDRLLIEGKTEESPEGALLFKGIASRDFRKAFKLANNIEVSNAALINGMLRIWLDSITPDDRKPKKIPIANVDSESTLKTKKGTKDSMS